MSAAEIISELPKLNSSEMRQVRRRLMELAAQNEAVAACDAAAGAGAAMLDQMEEEDVRNQAR